MFAVPYVFERIYAAARRAARDAGRGELFDRAVSVAARYAEAEEAHALGRGPGPGALLRLRHTLYDRLVYRRLRAVLGGRTRNVVSGGSALHRELGLVFAGAGIKVYNGYGLTETTGAVTARCRGCPGSARWAARCRATLRIADDGEVWVRGPMVFAGYVGDDGAGADLSSAGGGVERAPRDGWLPTGDLGELDEGHLMITGGRRT